MLVLAVTAMFFIYSTCGLLYFEFGKITLLFVVLNLSIWFLLAVNQPVKLEGLCCSYLVLLVMYGLKLKHVATGNLFS